MVKSFEGGHALLIGVGADLIFTMDDARGLANILKDPEHCAYPPEQVQLLIGEAAHRQAILDALDRLAKEANQSSTVIIYFSGHGYRAITPISESHFLIPFDVHIGLLKDTAISGSEFAARLKAIRSKKLLLLFDCCHAGGVGLAKNLELANAPLPPEVLEIIEHGKGRMIITSCNDNEVSYGGRLYSAFALALIEAFTGKGTSDRDGFVRAVDLAAYIRETVPGRTGGKQHPVLHFEDADNFEIAYYAGGDKEQREIIFDAEPTAIFLSDKATAIDLLGYKKFTDPIAKRINQLNASDTPLTIGIFGEWGTGKTSFLEMVRESLSNNYNINYIVFNAWKYEDEENLWSALLQCFLNHAEINGSWYERLKIKLRLWKMTINLRSGLSEIGKSIISTIFKVITLIFLVSVIIIIAQLYIPNYVTKLNLTENQVDLVGGSGLSALLLSLFIVFVIPKAETLLDLFDKNLNMDFSKFSITCPTKNASPFLIS